MSNESGDLLDKIKAEVEASLEEERGPSGGPAYQIVPALIALAVGIGAAILAAGYGLGSLKQPGPGLWPCVVGVVIAVCAAVLLVIGRGLTDSEKFTKVSLLPAIGALTFIAMGVLIPLVGFEIPAFVFCVIWLRFLGRESWRSTIAVSLSTVVVFYFLFLYGLRIPLPHLF